MSATELSIIDRENIHAKLRFISNVVGMMESVECAEGFGPDAPLALSLLLSDIALEVFPEGRILPFADSSPPSNNTPSFGTVAASLSLRADEISPLNDSKMS